MIDLVQAEKDLYQLLLSSAQLSNINFARQRVMQLKSEVDMATAWTTPRNGCAGCGGIVMMPEASSDNNNVAGPVLDWVFKVHVLEQPALNWAKAQPGRPMHGTFTTAEEVVQMVLDEVHLYCDDKLATFKVAQNAVVDANINGVALGYMVSFKLAKGRSTQTLRTGQVQVALSTPASGQTTLACAGDPAAALWYTVDGSFPANDTGINPQAKQYEGPVAADPGTVLRARAYMDGKLGGAAAYAVTT